MVAEASSKPCTIDDLAQFPDGGKLREIIDGQGVEWDVTNVDHGFFAGVSAATAPGRRLSRWPIVCAATLLIRCMASRRVKPTAPTPASIGTTRS